MHHAKIAKKEPLDVMQLVKSTKNIKNNLNNLRKTLGLLHQHWMQLEQLIIACLDLDVGKIKQRRLSMAQINITTTIEEQNRVLEAIKKLQGQTVAVSAIASMAGMNQSRVRYVITDLEEAGKIKRVPVKAFNVHYIRYKYEVLI